MFLGLLLALKNAEFDIPKFETCERNSNSENNVGELNHSSNITFLAQNPRNFVHQIFLML